MCASWWDAVPRFGSVVKDQGPAWAMGFLTLGNRVAISNTLLDFFRSF